MRYASAIVLLLSIIIVTVLPIVLSAEPEQSICGDTDGDGSRNIADVIYLDRYLWQDGPAPVDMWTANFGGCTGVNVHDLQYFVDFSFSSAPPGVCDMDTACTPDYLGAISLDSISGLFDSGRIFTGCRPRFFIRLNSNSSTRIVAMSAGFRVYSIDGATWDTAVITLTDAISADNLFDAGRYARGFRCDGDGADTLGTGGWRIFRYGLPSGYNAISFIIEIGPIPMESVGRTICIDSCWFPPGGDWLLQYVAGAMPPSTPSWSGERCFTVESCCEHRGNLSLSGSINVSDLTYLIAHLFQGGPGAACFEVGDVNGDLSGPNISDLTYLVTFLFQGGGPPPGC